MGKSKSSSTKTPISKKNKQTKHHAEKLAKDAKEKTLIAQEATEEVAQIKKDIEQMVKVMEEKSKIAKKATQEAEEAAKIAVRAAEEVAEEATKDSSSSSISSSDSDSSSSDSDSDSSSSSSSSSSSDSESDSNSDSDNKKEKPDILKEKPIIAVDSSSDSSSDSETESSTAHNEHNHEENKIESSSDSDSSSDSETESSTEHSKHSHEEKKSEDDNDDLFGNGIDGVSRKSKRHGNDIEENDDSDDNPFIVPSTKKAKKSKKVEEDIEGKQEKMDVEEETSEENHDGNDAGDTNRNENIKNTKIFMSGLPYTATETDVQSFFQNCGTITHIELPLDYDGRASGSALVTFDTTDGADAAVALHGEIFDVDSGRWVRIKYDTPLKKSKSYAEKQHDLKPIEKPKGCLEVYIGNLSWDIDEETVREFFAECGTIEQVRFAEDRTTGEFRGFGHVKFAETESTDKAVELSGTEVLGKNIRIHYALESTSASSSSPPASSQPKQHKDKEGSEKIVYSPKPDEQRRKDKSNNTDIHNSKVFVQALPYSATEDDIKTFFQHCGNMKQVQIRYLPDGKSSGTAVVEFKSSKEVKNALALDHETFDNSGRFVTVRPWAPKGSHNQQYTHHHQQQQPSKKPDGSLDVYIGNLPSKISEDAIRTAFEEKCGEINYISFIKDRETHESRGYGYIHFKDTISVDKAVKMSGVDIMGKHIKVNFAFASKKKGSTPTKSPKGSSALAASRPLTKKEDGCTSVFIGNLSKDMTEERLKDVFKECGEIKQVFVSVDDETGKCKGFGHIKFKKTESTDKAVKDMGGMEIMGRYIRVDYSNDKKKQTTAGNPKKAGRKRTSGDDEGDERGEMKTPSKKKRRQSKNNSM